MQYIDIAQGSKKTIIVNCYPIRQLLPGSSPYPDYQPISFRVEAPGKFLFTGKRMLSGIFYSGIYAAFADKAGQIIQCDRLDERAFHPDSLCADSLLWIDLLYRLY